MTQNKLYPLLLAGLGCAALGATAGTAQAQIVQPSVNINAGPLGNLTLNGGIDGYVYGQSGAGDGFNHGLLGTNKSAGAEFFSSNILLKKPTGLLQFTFNLHPANSLTQGYRPTSPFFHEFPGGPIYAAYITLAPSPNFSIAAGELYSLEGWESSVDWRNANIVESDAYFVENSSSRGVEANFTHGPVSGTVEFGDGFVTGRFNFLQVLGTYEIDKKNTFSIYGATNLSSTPLDSRALGFGGCSYRSCTVARYGSYYINSTMVGGYYSYTIGNLNLVPEIQYVYAKVDHRVGVDKFTSNLAAIVYGDYKIGKGPWSVGSLAQYFTSNGPGGWYLNPRSQGYGLSVTPTWQKDFLFVRGDVSLIHLTSVGDGPAYGSSGTGRNQAIGVLEAGLLF